MGTGMTVMDGVDAISAKLARCYISFNKKRYNFMNLIDMEAKVDKTKSKVPRLGATMVGHKTTGAEGTFSGTKHYNQSVLRQMLADYVETGVDVYFTMIIQNVDTGSAAEGQTAIFYGCNLNGGVIAKLDANGEYLDEPCEGTFEDFEITKKFKQLPGLV